MKRIVLLDTWISNRNLGNRIIVDAISKHLRSIFPGDIVYHLPALEYLHSSASRWMLSEADYVFYAGTNMLRSDMNHDWSEWQVGLRDRHVKNVILFGVGWWQYQKDYPNFFTRRLLKQALHPEFVHSMRDSYSTERLGSVGLKTVNTGCPTIWFLNAEHCAEIPHTKANRAVITFTEWKKNPEADKLMYQIVKRNYETVHFWPQQFDDYAYVKSIVGDDLDVIQPSLEAYDEVLSQPDVDFVGNRLHGGIRALQHKKRTIIIAIDNRAEEMGKDFKLPVCLRDDTGSRLEEMINSRWETKVILNQVVIDQWKQQFVQR